MRATLALNGLNDKAHDYPVLIKLHETIHVTCETTISFVITNGLRQL